MNNSIIIKNIKKKYRIKQSATEINVLNDISLEIKKGEFIGIIGPNGCGKTTLFKLIMDIEQLDYGSISIFGKKPERTKVSYVPQHTAGSLYPWFNVIQNIAFVNSKESVEGILNILEEFKIKQYARAYPYQLSGGLKQLVSIARSTLFDPDIFLFDEPFNSLDYKNRFFIEQILLKLRNEKNTAIIVSHDIESLALICDKIIVLSDKPARIKTIIPINLPNKRTEKTRFLPIFNEVINNLFNILEIGRENEQLQINICR